jgi:hypothetical protein
MTLTSLEHVDYGQRVLLFCDILGWAKFIEEKQNESYYRDNISLLLDEVWRNTERIQEIKREGKGLDFDLTVGHFSDTIVYSCVNSREATSLIVGSAAHMSNRFLVMGFVCRGAIVVGPLIHHGAVIFGPALVRAYEMEAKIAINPRILVAPEVTSQINNPSLLRHDPDGHWVVDTFAITWRQTNGNIHWNRANLMPISQHITRELRTHETGGKVHSKWLYATRRFNDFVTLHPELNLSPISEG